MISIVPLTCSTRSTTANSSVAAPEVVGEHVGLEGEDRDHDEHQDRHDLGDGDDAVDDRRLLDAAQHQEAEQPDADRRDTTTASTVSPSPNAGKTAPIVAMISTQ